MPELPEVETVRQGLAALGHRPDDRRGRGARTRARCAGTPPAPPTSPPCWPARTVTDVAPPRQVPVAAAGQRRRGRRPPRACPARCCCSRADAPDETAPAGPVPLHRRRPGAALRRPAHVRRAGGLARAAPSCPPRSRTSPATRWTRLFDADAFVAALRRRRTEVKRALLDQTLISGRRQHLRRRGAVAGPAARRPADRRADPARPRAGCSATSRDVLRRGARAGRHQLRRALRQRQRRERLLRPVAATSTAARASPAAAAARRSAARRS